MLNCTRAMFLLTASALFGCTDPKLANSNDPPAPQLTDGQPGVTGSSRQIKSGSSQQSRSPSEFAAVDSTEQPVPNDAAIDEIVRRASGTQYFVTVAHLSNSGRSSELDVYRYGVTKALNSISTNPKIIRLQGLDKAKTIFQLNPSDFRLGERELNIILRGPGAAQGVRQLANKLIIKGDWLVYSITRPEVYDLVMRIPNDVGSLERQLGIDNTRSISAEVGDGQSEVTFGRRTLIRYPIEVGGEPGGYYWRSIDYFQFLTAGEFFFSLPNGLQGYMLSGFANQHRIDAQPFVATDRNRPQDGLNNCVGNSASCGYVINGESCITCHANGVKMNKNFGDIRGGSLQEFESLVAQDAQRFSRALELMGYDNIGTEPILETLKAYRLQSNIADRRQNGSEINPVPFSGAVFQR